MSATSRPIPGIRQNVFQKNLADEQQMTANINSMNDWDWGPWGGYPYPGWYY